MSCYQDGKKADKPGPHSLASPDIRQRTQRTDEHSSASTIAAMEGLDEETGTQLFSVAYDYSTAKLGVFL